MNRDETLKLALEALKKAQRQCHYYNIAPHLAYENEIKALEEALAKQERDEKRKLLPRCFADYQPNHTYDRKCEWCAVNTECQTGEQPKQEQGEPVAITITGKLGNIYSFTGDYSLKKGDKVYTTPQQRKPLTDGEIADMWQLYNPLYGTKSFVRAIEAAHNIKE